MSFLKEIKKIKKEGEKPIDIEAALKKLENKLNEKHSEEKPNEKHKQNIKKIKIQIEKQRKPIKKLIDKTKHKKNLMNDDWVISGVPGFDELLENGIPRGTSVLIAGGAGSGKTIFSLQVMNNAALSGEKGLYISLEESEDRLKKHMHNFGWDPERFEKNGLIRIKRVDPFEIARDVEALLSAAKGELKMNIAELGEIIPRDFKPKWIFIDSLTALSAAFKDDTDSYRIYIEQLFRYFERLGVTSFLISETEQIPTKFSKTGVEEFLADAVIVLYSIKRDNIRENAIEILKLRGAKHQKKIVAMQIIDGKGIIVYPEQEIFGGMEK